eukprot:2376538-Amphidinium_carterae.1
MGLKSKSSQTCEQQVNYWFRYHACPVTHGAPSTMTQSSSAKPEFHSVTLASNEISHVRSVLIHHSTQVIFRQGHATINMVKQDIGDSRVKREAGVKVEKKTHQSVNGKDLLQSLARQIPEWGEEMSHDSSAAALIGTVSTTRDKLTMWASRIMPRSRGTIIGTASAINVQSNFWSHSVSLDGASERETAVNLQNQHSMDLKCLRFHCFFRLDSWFVPACVPPSDLHSSGHPEGATAFAQLALGLDAEEKELWRQLRRKRDFEAPSASARVVNTTERQP